MDYASGLGNTPEPSHSGGEAAMHHGELISQELMKREREFWTAIRDRDARTAVSLSQDPCMVVGAQGIGELDRRTLGKMLQDAPYDLQEFSLEDVHVRKVTDDVVSVAYKVREKMVVDGEEVRIEAFDASVWVWRDGKWVCALQTESLAGDPFGRH